MNSRFSEKVCTPSTESAYQQGTELKNNRNKMSTVKDGESQNSNATDSESPKIENLVEPIEQQQQQPLFKNYHRGIQNGLLHAKRQKLENNGDEYEPIDMTTGPACHVMQEQDDCEVFGRSIAAQLRQMSRTQKILTQRLIAEVCFRGQVQVLQMNTVLVNQSSNVFQQQVPQPVMPAYPSRTTNFNSNSSRGPDYLMSHHHQNMRQQLHMPPVTLGAVGISPPQYQNYMNLQQSDHVAPGVMSHGVNQNEVMP